MTREKALMLALKIVDVCKRYGNKDRCCQCPFNIKGCIVTDGNNIPSDWAAGEVITALQIEKSRNKGA